MHQPNKNNGSNRNEPDRTGRDSIQLDCRILYVEDDPMERETVARFLIQTGAGVTLEWDAQGAVDLITKSEPDDSPFDLLLINAETPMLNGCRAILRLREFGFQPPVFAITAEESVAGMERCYAAGCDEWFAKPLDLDRLLHFLARYCPSSGYPPEPETR